MTRILCSLLALIVMAACAAPSPEPIMTGSPTATSQPTPPTLGPNLGNIQATIDAAETLTPPPTAGPPTMTPTPTVSTLTVALTDTAAVIQNRGVHFPRMVDRIGIGEIEDITPYLQRDQLLLTTSTGVYAYSLVDDDLDWWHYFPESPSEIELSAKAERVTVSFIVRDAPRLLDSTDGAYIAELAGWHGGQISPDGTLIAVEERPTASAIDPFTGRIWILDVEKGRRVQGLSAAVNGFWGVA